MKKSVVYLSFTLFVMLASCAFDSRSEAKSENTKLASLKDSSKVVQKPKVPIDTQATVTARFIASVTSSGFEHFRRQPFYSQHDSIVSNAWTDIMTSDVLPIRNWVHQQKITSTADTLTLFYPFSGPDFLYANAFFPYAKRYIMVGMEPAGTFPKLADMPDTEVDNYLQSIRYSLRYINERGYFVTMQMMEDFAKKYLDGNLHCILYYLARTDHQIVKITNVTIDKNGNEIDSRNFTGKYGLPGVRVDFTDADAEEVRTVYYVPVNLNNDGLALRPEFLQFVKNFGRGYTYVKSGSYLLHYASFSTLRNFVSENSNKILQDDTGIPYYIFKNLSHFDLTLYGNYSRTIPEFPTMLQTDLKKVLDSQTGRDLPFSVGYNDWYNETVLFYGVYNGKPVGNNNALASNNNKPANKTNTTTNNNTNQGTPTPVLNEQGLFFRVQIYTSAHKIDPSPKNFNSLPDVSYYYMDGIYKYTIGNEKDLYGAEIKRLKQLARDKGYKDAFTIAVHNGKRISIDEAKKLLKAN